MDFTPLTDALSSKSYDKISDICDELILKAIFLLSKFDFGIYYSISNSF